MKTTIFHSLTVQVSLFYYISILCGVALLLVLIALVLYAERAPDGMRPHLLRGAVVLLSLELLFNFIIPCFYVLGSLAPLKADPYKGAPYIDFVRAANTDHSRIFARGQMLYANWSAAFQLADVRNVDAMIFKRYRTFARAFLLPPEAATRLNGDLADRFTGDEFPYEFDTAQEKRFLALSSVRYLITDSEFGWPPNCSPQFWTSTREKRCGASHPTCFVLAIRPHRPCAACFSTLVPARHLQDGDRGECAGVRGTCGDEERIRGHGRRGGLPPRGRRTATGPKRYSKRCLIHATSRPTGTAVLFGSICALRRTRAEQVSTTPGPPPTSSQIGRNGRDCALRQGSRRAGRSVQENLRAGGARL